MDLVTLMGVDFGTTGVPHYQDLSFKFNFPVRKGVVTFFGIGGFSSVAMLDSKADDQSLYTNEGQDLYNGSGMVASGISFLRYLTSETWAKFILSGSYETGGTQIDTLDAEKNVTPYYDHKISEYKLSLTALTGTKFSAGLSSRAGIIIDQKGYALNELMYDYDSLRMVRRLDESKALGRGGYLFRAFYELNYKSTGRWLFTPGVHILYYTLTGKPSVEPRLGIAWTYITDCRINFGYGSHAKTHTLGTYFLGTYLPDGRFVETNKDLGYTKSQQIVLGHDWNPNDHNRLKAEVYYQYIYNVPVEPQPGYFSLLNTGAGWGTAAADSLVNEGTGRNYGFELTLERFLSKGFYYLFTASLFDSKYRGSDGIERNSAFNGNYVFNLLAGKEFPVKKKSALTIDLKVTWAGGTRYIPVDTEESQEQNATVWDLSDPYADRYPDYFKADIKFGFKTNGKRITQEYLFFIENFTNHKNIYYQNYKKSTGEIITVNQLPFYPMMQFRLTF